MYQPSHDSGESRRSPRDQSPGRYNDRDEFRGGSARGGARRRSIPDARANHNAFQSNRDTFREPVSRDSSRDSPPRDPPRGPRNLIDPPTGPRAASHGSDFRGDFGFRGDSRSDRGRGRGRGWRDDSRDRGRDGGRAYRDRRDDRGPPPSFHDDRGRERWGRDTSYRGGRRPSSPPGRARSLPYGPRDNRDAPPSIELDHTRRGSRDGPLSDGSPLGDSLQPSFRGYGRGRGGYYEDFRRTPRRSRSPDPTWSRRTQPSVTPSPQVPAFGSTSSNLLINSNTSTIPGPTPSSSAQDVSAGPVPGVAVPTAPRSHIPKGQTPQGRPHMSSTKWINPNIKAPPQDPSSLRSGVSDAMHRRSCSPTSKSTHNPDSRPSPGNENHAASEMLRNEEREIREKPDSISPTSTEALISAQDPPRKRRPILGKRPRKVNVPALRDIPDNALESDSADDFNDNYFENEIAKVKADIARVSENNLLLPPPEPPAVFLTPFIETDLDNIVTFSESLAIEECVPPKVVEKAIPAPPELITSLAPKPRGKGKSPSTTPRPEIETETATKPVVENGVVANLESAQSIRLSVEGPGASDIIQPPLSNSIEQDSDIPQPIVGPNGPPNGLPATDGRPRKLVPKMETFDENDGYQTEAERVEALEAVRRKMKTPAIESLPNFKCKLWYQDEEFLKSLESKPDVETRIKKELEETRARRQREQEEERWRWKERYLEYRRWTDFSEDPVAVRSREKFAKSRAKAAAEAAEAAAPHPSSLPSAGTKQEGQRLMGSRFATEHFERVLRESEQEAKETKDREERVARARTASAKEATIPDMAWDEEEWMDKQFVDRTHLVPFERSFAVLEFGEPVDNFTEEEQQILEQVYLKFPKQWGKIAEALKRRDYKACIQHYYLVKHKSNLKEKLKKQPKKRKGRKANKGLGNPKSNALIADLGNRDEADDGQEAENGGKRRRPRRAAAPTWPFEAPASESEVASPAPAPGRQTAATLKGDGTEAPPKQRKAKVPREKGPKQSKNSQLLTANRRDESPALAPTSAEWKGRRGSAGSARFPPQYDGTNNALQPYFAPPSVPIERPNPSMTVNFDTIPSQFFPRQERLDSAPPMTFDAQQDRRNVPQTSSYWSVPEVAEFPALLRYYGTDWHGIAKHMTTKTHIMVYTTIFQQWLAVPSGSNKSRVANIQTQVKNYYQRQVDSGKMKGWEDIATETDEKKKRGESTGSPPQSTILTKRRYDGTPDSVPRAGSAMDGMDDLPTSGQSTVLPQTSPPQPPSLPGTRFPLLQAAAAPQIQPAAPAAVLAKHLPPQPIQQAPQQVQPQPRPPRGFFSTESPRPIVQADAVSQRSLMVAQEAQIERQSALRLEREQREQQQQQQQQAAQQTQQQALVQQQAQQQTQEVQQQALQQDRLFQMKQESNMPNLQQYGQYSTPSMHSGTTTQSRPEPPKPAVAAGPAEIKRPAPLQQQFQPRSHQAVRSLLTNNLDGAREIRSSPSPAVPRPPMSAPPVTQESYSAPPQLQPAPIPAVRPQETVRKTSSIMSLLNDEPSDPRPTPPKRVSDISVSSLQTSRIPPLHQPLQSRYSQPSSQPPQQMSQQMAPQQSSQQQRPPQHAYAPSNQHFLHQYSSSIGQPRSYTSNSFESRVYAPPPTQQQQQMYSQPLRQSVTSQTPPIRREASLSDMHGIGGGYTARTSAPSQLSMRLKDSAYSANPTPPPQPARQPAAPPLDRAPHSDRDYYQRQ